MSSGRLSKDDCADDEAMDIWDVWVSQLELCPEVGDTDGKRPEELRKPTGQE